MVAVVVLGEWMSGMISWGATRGCQAERKNKQSTKPRDFVSFFFFPCPSRPCHVNPYNYISQWRRKWKTCIWCNGEPAGFFAGLLRSTGFNSLCLNFSFCATHNIISYIAVEECKKCAGGVMALVFFTCCFPTRLGVQSPVCEYFSASDKFNVGQVENTAKNILTLVPSHRRSPTLLPAPPTSTPVKSSFSFFFS